MSKSDLRGSFLAGGMLPLVAVAALSLGGAHVALAKSPAFKLLYTFTGGNDGKEPAAQLLADKSGNLYGTAEFGGASGYGTVFKVAPNGTETTLYTFTGANDGANPIGDLIEDDAGNFYGTAAEGGSTGNGVVFKLASDGTETVLHNFIGGSDGANPWAGLVADKKGNLYGTTQNGGADGAGVVFKVAPNGTETVLYTFTGGNDGGYPESNLVYKSGNLYGTTNSGGADGSGVVYEIPKGGTETVLYSFTGGADGSLANGAPIVDSAGNIYGTTLEGGSYGVGAVYKVTAAGTESVVYSFTAGADGGYPDAGLIMDATGNLYGTTERGGNGNGVAFKVAPDGTETVLYSFTGGNDGSLPRAALIKDAAAGLGSVLFGTALKGGADGDGTIFAVRK